MKLVVSQPFADFKVGDSITDSETIAQVLESHPNSVVKTVDYTVAAFPVLDTAPASSKVTRR